MVPSKRLAVRVLRIVSVVLPLIGGIAVVTYRSDKPRPPHPKQWDPRVLDLVTFVEAHRGLKFKEPVFVDFLDAKAYSDRIRTDQTKLTDEDRKGLDTTAGELRALGLMTGDINLFDANNELVDTGSLAFYSPDTERVTVRGTDMTVGLRVTLAHELTHALQDQSFGIGHERTDKLTTTQEATGFRAVLEGDAVRIGNEYIDQLSADDKQQYETEHAKESDDATKGLSNVPAALQAFQFTPYAFGPSLMELLDVDGHQQAVDDAFRNPPVSEEQLVDPRIFKAHTKPLDVESSSFLHDGIADDKVAERGDLGWVTWFVLLAERIDPFTALQAADGWGGDAYVAYQKDGKTCMNIVWAGATSTDFEEMQSAVTAWVAAMPAGAASTSALGDELTLMACDPGTNSGITINNRAFDAMQLPTARSQLTLEALRDGHLSLDKAFVAADCVVHSISFDRWAALGKGDVTDDDFGAQIGDAIPRCLPR